MNAHNRRLLPFILTLFVLLAFSLLLHLLYRFDNKYTVGPPYGETGVFFFTESDLNSPLFLIDGWLLNNQEVFIGQYSNFSFLPDGTSPFGEGVYQLTLRYDGAPATLLLEIPPIFTEFTLTINGKPVDSRSVVDLQVSKGDTVLELHTINRSHYYSGLIYPPALGTPVVINQLFFTRTLIYTIFCTAALTLAAFSLVFWVSRAKDALFRHFGILCLAFALHCIHPFIWQFAGYSTLWYAIEDTSWLLVLAQAAALAAIVSGIDTKRWYRLLIRPVTLLFCLLVFISVLFIIPNMATFVNLFGSIIDGYKIIIWIFLALCAGFGLVKNTGWLCFFVLSVCGVLGVSLLAGIGDSNAFEPICGAWQNEYAGFAMVILFGGVMVWRNAQLLEERTELQSVKLQNRFAAESAAQTRASIMQVRTLKHELRHHIETLEALYTNRDYVRLGEYLKQLNQEKDMLPQLYYTENFLVNAILTGHLGSARENGIQVNCLAHVPEQLAMADADLCTFLANMLDNAVEACQRLPQGIERFITLSLETRQDLLLVTCINSAPHITTDTPVFSTSKPDPESHGLGILAMRRVAEKYDGGFEVTHEGGRFTLRAALHIPQVNR